MSPHKQPTSINPNSLKIRLAYRFLHNLNNLNNLNTKRSNLDTTQINRKSHRIKIAAYASMASVVGSRRAWSRAILWKIRNQGVLARNKKRVDHKTTYHRHHHHVHKGSKRRRNPKYPSPKTEYIDPFANSGQEVKLRKLVPGAETMDACGLLDETADYIRSNPLHSITMADEMVMCSCGAPTLFRTSWTRANPGRRFYCCAKKGASCGFVSWSDPPMCRRSVEIIPGLLERCNRNEAMAKDATDQKRKLKCLLVLSWCLFLFFFVIKVA